MKRAISLSMAVGLLLLAAQFAGAETTAVKDPHWEISGDLTEACTCAVPCTCNFGEGPSPKHYCHSLFAIDIQRGHYGDLKLDGLRLAGAHGRKSDVWYLDERATPGQAAALRAIANHMFHPRHAKVYFETAAITQVVGEKSNELKVGDRGGFESDYIMGMDKKTPVIVENNTSWNIPRSIKTKTKSFRYSDEYGNKIDIKGSNGNQGKFDWTDETKNYF